MASGGDADDDLDDLDADLDDDGAAPAPARRRWTRWPTATPAWARSPVAALALAAAAGLAGAAAGSAHRTSVDRQSSLAQSLTVGSAYVASQELRAGGMRAVVNVSLLNHGTEPVDVLLQGLTTPHQGTAQVPDAVHVGAGSTAPAALAVDVDCPASLVTVDAATGEVVPDGTEGGAGDAPAAAPTRLLASVTSQDGSSVDVELPVLDELSASLEGELTSGCGNRTHDGPETGWLWLDSGALRVTVSNPLSAAEPVRLLLDASPGLAQTATPALPQDLAPGDAVVVDLRVAPDCAVVGDGSDQWLELRAREPRGATYALSPASSRSTTPGTGTGTGPWLARQIALACG